MVTGEARPIAKQIGDEVIGGALNENGSPSHHPWVSLEKTKVRHEKASIVIG